MPKSLSKSKNKKIRRGNFLADEVETQAGNSYMNISM